MIRGFNHPPETASPRTRCPQPSERGFTLLETLVAVMILALALVVVLELFSSNLRSTQYSEDYSRGIFHARMKMDELLYRTVDTDEDLAGQFEDGFVWRAALTPYGEAAPESPVSSHQLTVEVSWQQGTATKRITLTSLKLVKSPETF